MSKRLACQIILIASVGLTGNAASAQNVPPPVEQVSANCAAPVYATDMLVCSDAKLRNLDAEMLRLWVLADSRRLVDDAQRAAQADWFNRRSRCAFEVNQYSCVASAYQTRIAALRKLAISN